ncbi:MAG: phosphoribosylanthranilate isomerase [Pseudomonadota bacterium]
MSSTRIKVCGLSRPEEAQWAAELGVDAIGLNFCPRSTRFISIDTALALLAGLPPFVTVTGLFLDADHKEVDAVLNAVSLDLLQFHGGETPAFCEAFDRPYIKSVSMGDTAMDAEAVRAFVNEHAAARAFLLDSNAVGEVGGTGKTFDWSRIPSIERPLILAGGLNPDNVRDAVVATQPYGVDVASGVEVEHGVKDFALMKKFVEEVRIVERG